MGVHGAIADVIVTHADREVATDGPLLTASDSSGSITLDLDQEHAVFVLDAGEDPLSAVLATRLPPRPDGVLTEMIVETIPGVAFDLGVHGTSYAVATEDEELIDVLRGQLGAEVASVL